MPDVITIGDAMITLNPNTTGPLKFVNSFNRTVGGAEFNFILGCARLGIKSGWIGRLGKDEFGQYIYNFARGEGIDVSHVSLIKDYPTSVYFKEVMEDGDSRSFYYREKSPIQTMKPDDLYASYFKNAKILHISGVFLSINRTNINIINRAIDLAKKNGLQISLDPNIRLKLWSKEEAKDTLYPLLSKIDILLAGEEEMEIIIGEKDPIKIIEKVKEIGVSFICIKQGEKGSVGYYEDEEVHVPSVQATKVVDTVGAGDGFGAGVIYGILNKWQMKETLEFANTIGSLVVSVKGDNDGLPYLEEVEKKMGIIEDIER